jgi:hypothetical protein
MRRSVKVPNDAHDLTWVVQVMLAGQGPGTYRCSARLSEDFGL